MRSSLKKNRNESMFQYFKKELYELKQLSENEVIDLAYFDETGCSLKPNVPYAWQKKGTIQELPAQRTRGISIMGVLNVSKQIFYGDIYQGAANAECVIKTLDGYVDTLSKKTILILDNASIHKAKIVKEKRKEWEKKGLYLQFIPPYCPELNLIEILWKHLKYFWLKPKHYQNMKILEENVKNILKQYGEKYLITFV